MRNITQRHQYILNHLKKEGIVKVQDLSQSLRVSEVTIRKDLRILEDKKLLIRNHGSASPLNSLISDKHVDEKEKFYIAEKKKIAMAATKLLSPEDKIIIASGTTLLSFADCIDIQQHLTVITSSVKVSLSLCRHPHIELVQLGGTLRKNSVSIIGHYAELMLNNLACNKLFIGVDGIDLNSGLTASDMNEAYINQKMIEVSDKVIVLTDSSKFGQRGFCKICEINQIHQIITDSNAPMHIVEQIRELGIEVTLV